MNILNFHLIFACWSKNYLSKMLDNEFCCTFWTFYCLFGCFFWHQNYFYYFFVFPDKIRIRNVFRHNVSGNKYSYFSMFLLFLRCLFFFYPKHSIDFFFYILKNKLRYSFNKQKVFMFYGEVCTISGDCIFFPFIFCAHK